MAGVLEGVRVLDLSWGIAGPMTAMLLADHGAQVTKIEPPGGDPFRGQLGYHVWQRGKKSAVLDLKDDADRATFLSARRSRGRARGELLPRGHAAPRHRLRDARQGESAPHLLLHHRVRPR